MLEQPGVGNRRGLHDQLQQGLVPAARRSPAASGGRPGALPAERDVVLLDEPTAHLDPPTAAALVRDLRAAPAGRVVVCVTHDDALAGPGDRVVRLGEPVATPAR